MTDNQDRINTPPQRPSDWTASQHYLTECKHGIVVSSCRCPGPHPVRVVACVDCLPDPEPRGKIFVLEEDVRNLTMRVEMLTAHSENLIERMAEMESQFSVVGSSLEYLEAKIGIAVKEEPAATILWPDDHDFHGLTGACSRCHAKRGSARADRVCEGPTL